MSTAQEAVETLTELGLTEYEARCFVALTRLSSGTAKEVSQVADVPRSRVYDTIERLQRRGLVEIQQSKPREFKAVRAEAACRRLREDYESRVNAAENALRQVEEPEAQDEEGVWSINTNEQVTDRIVTFLDGAEEAVHFVLAEDEGLDRRILDRLEAAAGRGVRVVAEVPTDDRRDRLLAEVPGATVLVTPSLRTTQPVVDEWPAQFLLVDERAAIAAGLEESDLPDVRQKTAVWTFGRDHGFAAWSRELLDARLADRDDVD